MKLSAVPAPEKPRAFRGGSYPGGIVEMDAVSAYPPELTGKYRTPSGGDTSWIKTPLECTKCKRQGNPGFIGNGVCYYCERNIN